jgi:hypothetical protein
LKHHITAIGLVIVLLFLGVGDGIGQTYLFNPKHPQSAIRHELNFSLFSHFTRSPQLATIHKVKSGLAYPEPIFNRVFGIATAGYEPRLRMIEWGNSASLSLDIPLNVSLSLVDITNKTREVQYSPVPVTDAEFNSGIYFNTREGDIGIFHSEIGALLSLNLLQGSTLENTKGFGLTFSAGVNRVMAPLFMNFLYGYKRTDYKGMLAWNLAVARFGLHFRGVAFNYMIGVNPTNIYFTDVNSNTSTSVFVNNYNRFSISFRLGQ